MNTRKEHHISVLEITRLTESVKQQSQTRALWPYRTELPTSSMLSESFQYSARTSQIRALCETSTWCIESLQERSKKKDDSTWKLIHLRSSETETNFDPQEDHSILNIEPSCPTSLNKFTAVCCWSWSLKHLKSELLPCAWFPSGLLRRGATCSQSTFHTIICRK